MAATPAQAAAPINPWAMTGGTACLDDHGQLHFQGREDDAITASGQRYGPGPLEDSWRRHQAVAMAGKVVRRLRQVKAPGRAAA